MVYPMWGLTTSQFVTAPKPWVGRNAWVAGLTTSQFVTAPKPAYASAASFPV